MAVRDALLVLLLNGPAYGFQLHGGLADRTGGRREVNVGQTYSTLDRLTGRGFVESAGETDDGLPLYRLTAAGRAAAHAWLDGRDAAGADPWHETVDRVLIALSMPDVAAEQVVEYSAYGNLLTRAGNRGSVDAPQNLYATEQDASDPLGGAVSDPKVGDTAFRWRNAHTSVQWYVGLGSTSAGNLHRAATWVNRCHSAASQNSVGGYVNYLEPGRELRSYYGGNYDRLVALNKQYDPKGLLNAAYSLPS